VSFRLWSRSFVFLSPKKSHFLSSCVAKRGESTSSVSSRHKVQLTIEDLKRVEKELGIKDVRQTLSLSLHFVNV
jgi:hypothetical protein